MIDNVIKLKQIVKNISPINTSHLIIERNVRTITQLNVSFSFLDEKKNERRKPLI